LNRANNKKPLKNREFLKIWVFWEKFGRILGGNPYFQFKNEGDGVGLYRLGKMGKMKMRKKCVNFRKNL